MKLLSINVSKYNLNISYWIWLSSDGEKNYNVEHLI